MTLSKCKFKLHLEFAEVNASCMSVQIDLPDHGSVLRPQTSGLYVFEHDIMLPTTLKLVFSGKNMDLDTILDSNGSIIKDKCVIVRKITLDGFAVDKFYLQKHLELKTDTQTIRSNYVGFNGDMTINFDCSNVFFQIQTFARIGKDVNQTNHAQSTTVFSKRW